MKKPTLDLKRRLNQKRRQRVFLLVIFTLLGCFMINLLFNLTIRLPINSERPIDAILVLGGSIKREVEAAYLARQKPEIPILISQGSADPCILQLFEREGANSKGVWLEKCARSTFGNFFFSTPILRRWGVHKVQLITSQTHLPRAQWLAQIHLGAQGIAVEVDAVTEAGIPGNRELPLKTYLDVTRSAIWVFFAQFIQPPCFDVIELTNVDLASWREQGFTCERNNG
jgi:uncharacterized SAM-binding protein YcdF (DUF218 family)